MLQTHDNLQQSKKYICGQENPIHKGWISQFLGLFPSLLVPPICQDCWKNTRSTFVWFVWLSSNPGDKVQKRYRTTGQICPVLLTRIWTLSPGLENNHTNKCWSGIFPTILTYIIMLENCQNNILVYGCSPIQGTQFYSCWNFMKPGSQNGTHAFKAG